jgi:uncharacterized protein (TIGR03545 family)
MTQDVNQSKSATKKIKKVGPIRTGVVVPVAIIFGLIWAYAFFMLDGHVRRGMEFAASKVYGAEVNIGGVTIKFLEPSLTIQNIEVTDKETPTQNAISVGRIKFALLWDALLRAKILIEESSITDIAISSPRKSPGAVYPPPPPEPKSGPSMTDKVTAEIKAEAEAQLKGGVFGDIAKVLGGADVNEQLKQMRDQLVSEAKIKELQASLTTKKDEWTKRINSLPKAEEAKAIVERVKAAKINTSNPAEAKTQVEALKKDLDQMRDIVAQYQKSQKDIQQDIGGFNDGMKKIDEAVRNDMTSLQAQFKLPEVDKDAITKALLNRAMGDKLVKITSFVEKAKAYMPDKSKKEDAKPEFVPHPRGAGRTYKFPVTVGYPLFWLKKAEISSRSTPEGFSGDFSGKILNVTSDAALINKPTEVLLAGDAPKQQLSKMSLKLVMDYRGDVGHTDVDLAVGSHQFPEQSFVDSPDMTFGIAGAPASFGARAIISGSQVSAKIREEISKPVFKTDAKQPLLKEALVAATGRIKDLHMEVTLGGELMNPKIGMESNLGTELADGFQRHLKAKIDEAKAKLKSFVDDRIKGERDKLMGDFNNAQAGFNTLLQGKDTEFKNLQADLEKAYKEKSSAGSKQMQQDIKNKAKDALKKLKL